MPIRLAAYQKFQFEVIDGLPLAHVASFGGICYVMVCPLCSAMHETALTLDTVGQTAVYRSRCLLREYAGQPRTYGQEAGWISLYKAWLKAHPEADDFTEVRALYIGAGASLPASYEGVIPHRPSPAVSIMAVREQERQANQWVKNRRRQSKQHTEKPAA